VNILTLVLLNSLAISLVLASFTIPSRAEAGVFSFLSSLFSSAEAETEEEQRNLQNLSLLQAPISPNQNQSGSGTLNQISIIDESALLPEASIPGGAKSISEDQISIYVVRGGETLSDIAKMFGVSINTIRWANDLKGNILSIGQTLVILPISGVQHIVKSGDTLLSIAKQHKGDLDEILSYNNLSSNSKLAIGDVIVIPDGEIVTISSPTRPSGSSSSSVPTYSGYYMRPIIGGIKTQGIHGRNGVDLASSYGANILASAQGDVIIARASGYNGGYGSYIVIRHDNGTQTLYAHLGQVLVSAGSHVNQGQVIGKMGSTGKSTGTHLHFEVRGARNPF